MARLTLSKASLTAQGVRLKIYQRYLPSLDLKRRQLISERARAAETLAETGGPSPTCGRGSTPSCPWHATLR